MLNRICCSMKLLSASINFARIERTLGITTVIPLLLVIVAISHFSVHAAEVEKGPWIPPPFEPVRVLSNRESSGDLIVSVWGRRYRFERGPLPVAIVSQNMEMFARPPRFTVDLGRGDQTVMWGSPSILEQRTDMVVLSTRGHAGPLEFTAETRIEYDGMIRVDLEFQATQAVRIQRYTYELTLPVEVAKSFNHHVPYDYASLRVDKREMLAAAGAFPDSSRRFAFVPTFFIGNRSVGLEWWCETNASWVGSGKPRPLELGHRREGPYFLVEPIAAPTVLEKNTTWSDTFAIFPTPLRAPPKNWRSIRFTSSWGRAPKPEERHLRRAFIAFPGQFEARWYGLPASIDNQQQRELRKKVRMRNALYIPYGALTAIPYLHPVAMKNAENWMANDQFWTGPPSGIKKYLKKSRNWKSRQPYGYSACLAREDYLEWMLSEFIDTFRREDLDGLYFDHATIHQMCLKNPILKGRAGRQVWEYFNVRRFYRRLYEAMKADNPDALLTIHTHGQPRSMAAWADFTFIGEGWNVLFRDGHRFSAIAKNPELYTPDYFRLPKDYLDAQLSPQLGGITVVLPEIHHGIDPKNPERAQHYQRAFLALILPYDVPIWHANSEPSVLESIFGAIDRFGPLDEASVYPWWERRGAVPSDDRLVVTTYTRDGRALIIVANWSKDKVTASLEFHRDTLELRKGFRVHDAEDRDSLPKPASGSSINVSIPPNDLRILIAE